MTVPLFRSLAAPLRRVRVTGPWVVGLQVRVAGLPAVMEKSLETVGGLAVEADCARAVAIVHAARERSVKRMFLCSKMLGMLIFERFKKIESVADS